MRYFGTIRSYDSGKGTGTISPAKGGDALPFRKSDMDRHDHTPKWGERFGYDVQETSYGKRFAINLAAQLDEATVQREQANAQ